MALSEAVEHAILTPYCFPLHEHLALLTALRMERMRDADSRGQLLGARCSTFIDRRRGAAARSRVCAPAATCLARQTWTMRYAHLAPNGGPELIAALDAHRRGKDSLVPLDEHGRA